MSCIPFDVRTSLLFFNGLSVLRKIFSLLDACVWVGLGGGRVIIIAAVEEFSCLISILCSNL